MGETCISRFWARIKLYWVRYRLLFIIAILQIVPPILRSITFFKEHDWLTTIINILIIILIIVFREIRMKKSRDESDANIESTKQDLADLSGSTIGLSAVTVNTVTRMENITTKMSNLEKRVSNLEKRTDKHSGRK